MNRTKDWRRAQLERKTGRKLRLALAREKRRGWKTALDGGEVALLRGDSREYRVPIHKAVKGLMPEGGILHCRCDYCLKPYSRHRRRTKEWDNATDD